MSMTTGMKTTRNLMFGIALIAVSIGATPIYAIELAPAPKNDTAFINALEDPRLKVVEDLLASGAEWHARNRYGYTLLHMMVSHNSNPAVISRLIKAGISPNARTENGWTPLHSASRNNNPAFVKTLLAKGADINARDDYGMTSLHEAARWNPNPEVIKTLIDAGADPNARDKKGRTPIDWAKLRNTNPGPVIKALKRT